MHDKAMSPETALRSTVHAGVTVYADTPGRLVAFGIDAVVLTIASFALIAAFHVLLGPTVRFDGADILRGRAVVDGSRALLDAIAVTTLGAAYFVLAWRQLGGSPGQRLLGIRVQHVDGGPLSVSMGLIRWAVRGGPLGLIAIVAGVVAPAFQISVDAVGAVWIFIVLLSIARSGTKRGLHDRIAGSVVTRSARTAVTATV
jgi:uncharacterized RDD family membrane protein YckC